MGKRSANGKPKGAARPQNGDILMTGDILSKQLPPAQPIDGTDDPMEDPAAPGEDESGSEIFEPEFSSEGEEELFDEEEGEDEEEEQEEEGAEEDGSSDEEMNGGAPLTTRESVSPSRIPLIGTSDADSKPSASAQTSTPSLLDSEIPSSLTVTKPIPYTYDAGHLLINDGNPLPRHTPMTREATFTGTARDAAQMLLNHLLTTCAIHTVSTTATSSSGVEMTLPTPVYQVPREKKVPEPKAPTKWERFAKRKGIEKGGKGGVQGREGKMVYDAESGEWVPKWGYKGRNKKGEGEWLVEVDEKAERKAVEKDGVAGVDPRSVGRKERLERVRRNERAMRANERRGRKAGKV